MIPSHHVLKVLKPREFSADDASNEMYALVGNGLDAADRYVLGRAGYQDRHKAHCGALNSTGATLRGTSSNSGGALMFGETPFPGNAGSMWMLQSTSLPGEANRVQGRRAPPKIGVMTYPLITLFLGFLTPLFKSIPNNQRRNIRWLGLRAFSFSRTQRQEFSASGRAKALRHLLPINSLGHPVWVRDLAFRRGSLNKRVRP